MKDFIRRLNDLNVFLVANGDELILKSKRGKLSNDEVLRIKQDFAITDFIKTNKTQLLEFLTRETTTEKHGFSSVYGLTSLQEGMLFHSLFDDSSNAYKEQIILNIISSFDPVVFKGALQFVVKNHTILRTSFFYENIKSPIQCVHKEVPVPFSELETWQLSDENRVHWLNDFLKKDLEEGFDFSVAPLLRVTLIRNNGIPQKLVITYHHIILDGWSTAILLNELFYAYENLIKGLRLSPQEEDKFEDYVQLTLKSEKYSAESFWRVYLEKIRHQTLLPTKQSSMERNKGAGIGKTSLLEFNEDFTERVVQFARLNRLTVNTIVQGVWSILLSSYSGYKDVVFGATVSGRPSELSQSERRVGLYLNTIPVTSHAGDELAILDWLHEIQDGHLLARQYQYLGLSEIQKTTGIHGNLFNSIVVFENYPTDAIQRVVEGDLSLKVTQEPFQELTNYDLTIVVDLARQLFISFIFFDSVIESSFIERVKSHFKKVIEEMIERPSQKVSDLDLLPPEERLFLLKTCNSLEIPLPETTVMQVIEHQAKLRPDKIAVVDGGTSLTYRALSEKSNRLANFLISSGLKRDELVPVMIPRSYKTLICIMAIWKANGVYVALDSTLPHDRRMTILGDCASRFIITLNEFAGTLISRFKDELQFLVLIDDELIEKNTGRTDTTPRIHIDQPLEELEYSNETPAIIRSAESISYVIYTSGSTGLPKGVLLTEGGLLNHLIVLEKDWEITNRSIVAQNSSVMFDVSIWQMLSALMVGGSLVFYGDRLILEVRDFLTHISADGVSHLQVVPSFLNEIIHSLEEGKNPGALSKLKILISGGEPLSKKLVEKWFQLYPQIPLINAYGPSEITDDGTYYKMLKVPDGENVPIGRPLGNVNVYILDKELKLCPMNVQGEICISKAGVGRGYLNDPELTNEKFLVDPFLDGGVRMFKTGDLGKWRDDGNVEYVGRIDSQVKMRGFRIELGEIEKQLIQSDLVRSCCVILISEDQSAAKLVAYLVPSDGYSREKANDFLSRKLPYYMIPSIYVEISEMPLNRNGKIDRRSLLSAPRSKRIEGSKNEETIYLKMAKIWADVLRVDLNELSESANFFDLGGHSLLVIRAVGAVRKEFQVEITVRDFFILPTLKSMVEHVRIRRTNDGSQT